MSKVMKKARPDQELIEAVIAAIEKEQQAQVFYTKAAGLATSKAVKDIFREFKADEVGHEKMLKTVLKELKKGKLIKKGTTVHMEPLSRSGLGIFKMKDIPRTNTSYEEALLIAMNREEDAWRGYSNMVRMAPTENLKDLFKLLAQFEAGHLKRLKWLYSKDFPDRP
jgi:rubrerythrin